MMTLSTQATVVRRFIGRQPVPCKPAKRGQRGGRTTHGRDAGFRVKRKPGLHRIKTVKKIITLYQRNYHSDRLVRDEVTPGAEWVIAGEGIATRKYDGTCCMVRDGGLYKRYDAQKGKQPPDGFEPAQDADTITGHWPGWLPVGDGPEDRWHREAFAVLDDWSDGTLELCGPKIQGNPEGFASHVLVRHGADVLHDCPRDFDGLRAYLMARDIEGVVWHHIDGRMVKLKRRDFVRSGPKRQ